MKVQGDYLQNAGGDTAKVRKSFDGISSLLD
jgi:hypothetical protein